METKLAGQTLHYDVVGKGFRRYRPMSKQVIFKIGQSNNVSFIEMQKVLKISPTTMGVIMSKGEKGHYEGINNPQVYTVTERTAEMTTYEKEYLKNQKEIAKADGEISDIEQRVANARAFNANMDKAKEAGVDINMIVNVDVTDVKVAQKTEKFNW